MAQFQTAFDMNEDYGENDFSPIPKGIYQAIIEDTEIKQTKDGQGSYLKVTFQIIQEGQKGRKVFDNLNLANKSADAMRIGKQKLKKIALAVGVKDNFNDSSILHDKPLLIKIEVDGEYNNVKDYKALNAQTNTTYAEQSDEKAPWAQQ